MESLSRNIVILTVIMLVNVSFAGTYSGGFGTEADSYQIGTVSDWQELMAESNDWDANFIMIADINLQGVPLTPVGGLSLGNNYMPLFEGIFDGNGHVVRNPTINLRGGYWHIGLFGLIDSNSIIKNLGVEDANMTGERDIAGLVGLSKGTITNCYATGKIGNDFSYDYGYASANPGGLVGLNRGTIRGCHAECDVNGNYAGGLVGRNEGGTIIDSYATGTVFGGSSIGGLVGWNRGYVDEYVYIIRFGTIKRCYASAVVSGGTNVGGLIGRIDSMDEYTGLFLTSTSDCYSLSTVTGASSIGGLVGLNGGYNINNCYAAGKITGSGGGLVGSGSLPTSNCFWDINTTGKTTSASGTGKTTVEMKTLSTFISAGWDFADTWGIGENQTYPFLRTYSGADLNYDGLVNFDDFAIWADHWLEGI